MTPELEAAAYVAVNDLLCRIYGPKYDSSVVPEHSVRAETKKRLRDLVGGRNRNLRDIEWALSNGDITEDTANTRRSRILNSDYGGDESNEDDDGMNQ